MFKDLGRLAFYAGIVLAEIIHFFKIGDIGLYLIGAMGLAVGILNIKESKNTERFLRAVGTLIVIGIAIYLIFGEWLADYLVPYMVFTSGAAVVVAFREIHATGKPK